MAGMRRNPLTSRRTGRPQNASVSGGASFSDFSELFGMGAPVASGQVVTPESAMRFSAVFACVRLLGGAVASAPVKVYLREGTEQRQLPWVLLIGPGLHQIGDHLPDSLVDLVAQHILDGIEAAVKRGFAHPGPGRQRRYRKGGPGSAL